MNISEFLKQYIADRDISVQELCISLGYKSKTSIDRIISGNVGIEALKEFKRRLENTLGMTDNESDQFSQIITKTVYGEDRACAFLGLHDMLSRRLTFDFNDFLLSTNKEDVSSLSVYITSHNITHIRIYNCIYNHFSSVIRTLLRDTNVHIEHYITMRCSDNMLVKVLSGVLDLMTYPNYKAYSYNTNPDGIFSPKGILLSDIITLEARYNHSSYLLHGFIVPDGFFHGQLITTNGFEIPLPPVEQYSPLNQTCPAAQSFDEFLNYCSQLANLEANTATFDLKPDICIMYVPFDILYSVFISSDLPDSFKTPEAISKLSTVFTRRVANTYNKRKPTIAIMSYDALQSFANTGTCSDHMPGLRPFTVEERIRIFEQLLNACKTNPWFEIYIRKDNYLEDYNICCYAGNGFFMASNDSNYLSAHSSEIILTPPPSFYTLFETYYREELIKNHCRSVSDSRAILRELSDSLKRICNQ